MGTLEEIEKAPFEIGDAGVDIVTLLTVPGEDALDTLRVLVLKRDPVISKMVLNRRLESVAHVRNIFERKRFIDDGLRFAFLLAFAVNRGVLGGGVASIGLGVFLDRVCFGGLGGSCFTFLFFALLTYDKILIFNFLKIIIITIIWWNDSKTIFLEYYF